MEYYEFLLYITVYKESQLDIMWVHVYMIWATAHAQVVATAAIYAMHQPMC